MQRLHTLTNELASAVSAERVAEIVIDRGVAFVGARSGALYLLEEPGSHVRLARVVGYGEQELERFARVPLALDTSSPLTDAIRRGEPVLLATHAEYAARYPASEARTRSIVPGDDAIACLPLLAGEECLGALTFAFAGARAFDDGDRAFLDLLAQHCTHALHRTRLLERERRYLARTRILADAGNLLATSLEYEETLRNVVRLALPVLADFSFLDVVQEDGVVRRISDAHDDPETLALLATTRWQRSERTDVNLCGLSSGATGFHPRIGPAWWRDVALSPEHYALLERLALASMITVPVVAGGATLGALTLCYGRSGRHHDEADVPVAEELARRAAQAVQQARLYQAAQAATRRAEDAARLKDEFLATVSHELRTPLTAILGWSTLLRGGRAEDPAALAKGLEVIERNARAQLRIVEDILDVSRIVRGQLRVEALAVDVAALARDVLESLRPSAEARRVALGIDAPPEGARLVGDPDRLRQILWNLLSNAVKFTPDGGAVAVRIAQAGARITLEIEDTGRGIEPAFLPHLFERFRQAESSSTRRQGGLGLGLAIVKHLTELHGGTVTAASGGLGHGATFTVVLPVRPFASEPPPAHPRGAAAGADAPPGDDAPPPSEAKPLAGVSVVVADDEADARDLVVLVLGNAGAEVRAARSAEAALAAIAARAPDVLVSDIGMPGHDGYWLVRRVRERHPGLPSVALTAFTRAEDGQRARAAGFDVHVGKPVQPSVLVDLVARAAARRVADG